MKINILGQQYELLLKTEVEFPKLKAMGANGLAELYTKQLIINRDSLTETEETFDNLPAYIDKVVRHEIIHAYFHEAGLVHYCNDEELVDWLALQIPKIIKTITLVEENQQWRMRDEE